jgi:PAS domain S-box-containing protein
MNTTLGSAFVPNGFSKAHTEAIISNMRMAELDRRCIITWANDQFCELTQYEKHELVGKPVSDLNLVCLDPEDFKAIHVIISSGEVWSGEVRTVAKDGSILWVKVNIIPVQHELTEIVSYLVSITNITATKHAFEKEKIALQNMKKSELRYRAVVENQSDIISLCNADGTRLFVNQSCCQFLGKTEQELVGSNVLDFPLKGLPQNVYFEVLRLTAQNQKISGVYELEDAAGRKVWISFLFKGIFDVDGNLYEILTIGRDVTELKTAEINRSKYVEELERISFMTSHKVRAPISQMQGFLELLRINAIHTHEWETILNHFKKSMETLDACTRELGAFVYLSQSSK